jgi:ketosteroid isomerase-like protein
MSTTTGTDNAATTAAIYEAFGRGDVPAILGVLAEDVSWEDWGDAGNRERVPWLRAGRGRDHVARFFEIVGSFEIHRFEVLDVIGDGRQVAVEVLIEASPPGGGRFCDEELHLWSFDEQGKVARMRHYVDTAKHRAASVGEDTTIQ